MVLKFVLSIGAEDVVAVVAEDAGFWEEAGLPRLGVVLMEGGFWILVVWGSGPAAVGKPILRGLEGGCLEVWWGCFCLVGFEYRYFVLL